MNQGLSRHEGDFHPIREVQAKDLPALLRELEQAGPEKQALVRFLAGADDWRDAGRRLSGAFAEGEAARLRRQKEE